MIILFVGAKDYDYVWFEKYANEKGYVVNFVMDKTEISQLGECKADILCMPYKEEFDAGEQIILKNMCLKAIFLRTDIDNYENKIGKLGDILVFEILGYSPSIFEQMALGSIFTLDYNICHTIA